MGSTTLAAAVPYPGKKTPISHEGQRSTKINKWQLSAKKTNLEEAKTWDSQFVCLITHQENQS